MKKAIRAVFFSTLIFPFLYLPAAAVTLTVGSASGNTGNVLSIPITVDNPEMIAGAAFTLTYSTSLTITVDSDFFDTFYNQLDPLSTTGTPDPDGGEYGYSVFPILDGGGVPTGETVSIPAVVDAVNYYQPLLTNLVTNGTNQLLISAARCTPAPAGGLTTIFTLNVALNGGQPAGIYPLAITPNSLNNTDAGYAAGGETIDLLVGSDLNEPVGSGNAFPVILDDVGYASNVVNGQAEFTVVDPDTDGDGILDSVEDAGCTSSTDADSDDDGIPDGVEDANHNGTVDVGETDPCNADTDGDGVQDGTEMGYTTGHADTDPGVFVPDADPATTTDPRDADSDNDRLTDGQEDADHNGRLDAGETDPNKKIVRMIEWDGKIIADFGASRGVYTYGTAGGWQILDSDGGINGMVVWDGKLVIDFGNGRGMWNYDGVDWNVMTYQESMDLITWDNGTPPERLVAEFESGGVWFYDSGWNWLTNRGPVHRMGIWNNRLVMDFRGGGIWNYDTGWNWMTAQDTANDMVTWDDGSTETLVVDLGNHRSIWRYGGAWNWLTAQDTTSNMAIWKNQLVVDIGYGRSVWRNDGVWNWMTASDTVNDMVPWNTGAAEMLVADFYGSPGAASGTWYWDDADDNWHFMSGLENSVQLLGWNNNMVVDYGPGVGIWIYDGSWAKIQNWSTAD